MDLLLCYTAILLGVSSAVGDLTSLKRPQLNADGSSTWSEWWRYEGFSDKGPEYWGLINPEWSLCEKGKQQSPVDINPKSLVFDPNLKPLLFEGGRSDGTLINTGRDVTFRLDPGEKDQVFLTGGPLSYRYQIHEVKIHFGSSESQGSEHTIAGHSFSAEIQILAFNLDVYQNLSMAQKSPHGLTAIAVFGIVSDMFNAEFEVLAKELRNIRYKGQKSRVSEISVADFLPRTDMYMTYEGSLTHPGCEETVTWMIINKPMYITKSQIEELRLLHRVEETKTPSLMENNWRPIMPLNHRTIRTNINPVKEEEECSTKAELFYQINDRFRGYWFQDSLH